MHKLKILSLNLVSYIRVCAKRFCNLALVDTSLKIAISVAETYRRHAVYIRYS